MILVAATCTYVRTNQPATRARRLNLLAYENAARGSSGVQTATVEVAVYVFRCESEGRLEAAIQALEPHDWLAGGQLKEGGSQQNQG